MTIDIDEIDEPLRPPALQAAIRCYQSLTRKASAPAREFRDLLLEDIHVHNSEAILLGEPLIDPDELQPGD